jgi:hypothetical protein
VSNDFFARFMQNADSRSKWREDRDRAEKILDERRKRYATDAAYRERIKDSVRKNRSAKQPSDKKRSFNRDRHVLVNGVTVFLYSSGKAASLMQTSARTVATWEKNAIIPLNRANDLVGRRWYPAEFVVFMAALISERSQFRNLADWSARVKEAWQTRQLSNTPIPVVCERLIDE